MLLYSIKCVSRPVQETTAFSVYLYVWSRGPHFKSAAQATAVQRYGSLFPHCCPGHIPPCPEVGMPNSKPALLRQGISWQYSFEPLSRFQWCLWTQQENMFFLLCLLLGAGPAWLSLLGACRARAAAGQTHSLGRLAEMERGWWQVEFMPVPQPWLVFQYRCR